MAALKENKSLHTLNLDENRIRNDGAEALFGLVKRRSQHLHLSLHHNRADKRRSLSIEAACYARSVDAAKQELPRMRAHLEDLRQGQPWLVLKLQEATAKEEQYQTARLHRQQAKLEQIKRQEEFRLHELCKELEETRRASRALSARLVQIQREARVKLMQARDADFTRKHSDFRTLIDRLNRELAQVTARWNVQLEARAAHQQTARVTELQASLQAELNSLQVARYKQQMLLAKRAQLLAKLSGRRRPFRFGR